MTKEAVFGWLFCMGFIVWVGFEILEHDYKCEQAGGRDVRGLCIKQSCLLELK